VPSLTTFGFRQHPYASKLRASVVYATSEADFRVDFLGDFRRPQSAVHFLIESYYSGFEVVYFFGFGNATPFVQPNDFYKVHQHQFLLAPSLAWSPTRRLRVSVGPVLKHASTDLNTPTFLTAQAPYGSGRFTELGARTSLNFDTRDVPANPTRGVHLIVGASLYPAIFDVATTFGEVHGEAATFLTAPVPLQPTLALRAGAQRVWGTFPFYEAAFVGGSRTVRGLRDHRYLGDASAYGNAELRLRLTRVRLVLPATVGIFGLADVGRVFLEGESSDKWHHAVGGGLWLAFLSSANTLSAAIARGEGRTGLYFRSGFMF
jgi:outer membrane protein assembly factor BamA